MRPKTQGVSSAKRKQQFAGIDKKELNTSHNNMRMTQELPKPLEKLMPVKETRRHGFGSTKR